MYVELFSACMGLVICDIIAFHVISYFEGLVHLSGVFTKLPQGLISLSLADNGITSKGTCILLSYYTYAAINFFGNLLKILRFKSLVFLCVYMLLSINKQCTFVSCGKIISLCTVDNSSFSFLTSLV